MKKLLLFLIISKIIFSSNMENKKINIYFLDAPKTAIRTIEIRTIDGKLTVISDENTESTKDTKSIRVEVYKPLLAVYKHSIHIGAGIKIEEPVEFNHEFSAMSYLTPIYFSTLYTYNEKKYDLFGKFNIGYELAIDNKKNVEKYDSDLRAKMQGSLYFGLEGGVVYRNIILGLGYNQTSTKLEIPKGPSQEKGKVDIDYVNYTINIGYQFN